MSHRFLWKEAWIFGSVYVPHRQNVVESVVYLTVTYVLAIILNIEASRIGIGKNLVMQKSQEFDLDREKLNKDNNEQLWSLRGFYNLPGELDSIKLSLICD